MAFPTTLSYKVSSIMRESFVVGEPLFLEDEHEINQVIESELHAGIDSLPCSPITVPIYLDDDAETEDVDALFSELSSIPSTLDVKPEEIDSMVAKEMSSLSIQEREKLYFGIHGVAGTIEETPKLIHDSLQQLQLELDKLDDSPAYLTAKEMNPAFVQDESFLLMFLRADLYDAPKAAKRIGLHFQFKLDLFGKEMLTRPITQDCLDEEARQILYSGTMCALDVRDSAGRGIILSKLAGTDTSIKAKLRALFYTGMLAVDDVESQRKGCVLIIYTVGQNMTWLGLSPHRREWNMKAGQLTPAIPIRFEAMHLCHDSLAMRALIALFKLGDMRIRLRMREHYGTREECMFSLQTYGIPTQDFPMDENGKILLEHRKEMLEKRHKLEQLRESQTHQDQVRISVPSRNDVLFGRGKAFYRHLGNMRLRAMVEERAPEYEATNVIGKQNIKEEVIYAVHKSGGRFLRDDGVGWVEVSDTIAGKKVAHAFRTLRGLRLSNASPSNKADLSVQGVGAEAKTHPLKRGRLD